MCFDGERSENQLPVFHNMKTLEMGAAYSDRWDIWLLLILHCSPLLETLVFPEGFYSGGDSVDDDRFLELAALEAEGWRTIEERRIPSCFITHLKRIKLTWCSGFSRDLNIIKYLLGKASVLEEFVISTTEEIYAKSKGDDRPNFDQFAIALAELPRASNSCSITLHRCLPRCSVEEEADRLSSLPDDLLSRILSLLPTKDVAATQVLSKRIAHAFCSSVTTLDLDDSPVSHCLKHPHLVDRFPLFESFVDNILNKFSQSKQPLTRFRFCLGREDKYIRFYSLDRSGHMCDQACLPDLTPTRILGWISFPLSCCGLRELDLSIHIRNPDDRKPLKGLFTWQSLKVLKIDSNFVIGHGDEAPVVFLPKVKDIRLYSFVFSEDDFVTNLVSSCPSLEDLTVSCMWVKSDRVEISSTSLRRLVLFFDKVDEEKIVTGTIESGVLSQLSLITAFSNAYHLSLVGNVVVSTCFDGENQLPVFHNVKTLEMGSSYCDRWDRWLLLILDRSPLLETLVFPEGFYAGCDFAGDCFLELAALEAEGLKTVEERRIPSCLITHLKRIKLAWCAGFNRDLNIIKFLLGKASVLEEFVISTTEDINAKNNRDDLPDLDQFAITLAELPRASNSCSVILQRWP